MTDAEIKMMQAKIDDPEYTVFRRFPKGGIKHVENLILGFDDKLYAPVEPFYEPLEKAAISDFILMKQVRAPWNPDAEVSQ